MRTRIKICGFTRADQLLQATQLGVDAVGLVFYPPSPRNVSIEQAHVLCRAIPPFVTVVGLFVDAPAEQVREVLRQVPLTLLQFHGDETPALCEAAGRPYIRAARMGPSASAASGGQGFDLLDFAAQFASAQALLLDAHVESYGGAGKVFDWSLIPAGVPLPVVLSGGLSPANVTDGVLTVRPWAVDVSSGVEIGKGLKSGPLMRRFCKAVREADDRIASL